MEATMKAVMNALGELPTDLQRQILGTKNTIG